MRIVVAAATLLASFAVAAAQDATRALAPAPEAAIDAALVGRARERAIAAARTARNDETGLRALAGLLTLARYGDAPARLELMRAYHDLAPARQAVSVEEITRYGLDVLASAPPGSEHADGDFIFNVALIEQSHRLQTFARAFVEALRDDARLREGAKLEPIMALVRMGPGACEALADEARRLKVEAPAEQCPKPFVDALIAHAAQAGPTGFETAARRSAEPGLRQLAE